MNCICYFYSCEGPKCMFGSIKHFCGCRCPNLISVTTLITIFVWGILRLRKVATSQHPCKINRTDTSATILFIVGLQDFKVIRFTVTSLRFLGETQIRVKVSSRTCVEIWISKTSLSKGLLNKGCNSNHQPHLQYHLKEILQILKQKYH